MPSWQESPKIAIETHHVLVLMQGGLSKAGIRRLLASHTVA